MKMLLTFAPMLLLGFGAAAQSPSTSQNSTEPAGTAGAPKTAAPDATPTRSTAPVTADYRLVPGDKIRVEVYKDQQLSQSVQVRPDGKITLPLANDIPAAGRTPNELRNAISTALQSYIANPTVTVIVQETVQPVVYVMGEVNKPGSQPLIGKLDVLQALSAAGGFKDFANTKKIRIRRAGQILRFNYNEAIEANLSPMFLQAGDTIIVP
jgi:polysaccharide biosynthesis/export protein